MEKICLWMWKLLFLSKSACYVIFSWGIHILAFGLIFFLPLYRNGFMLHDTTVFIYWIIFLSRNRRISMIVYFVNTSNLVFIFFSHFTKRSVLFSSDSSVGRALELCAEGPEFESRGGKGFFGEILCITKRVPTIVWKGQLLIWINRATCPNLARARVR